MGGLAQFMRHPIEEYRKNKIKKAYHQLQLENIRKIPRAMRALRKVKHPLSLVACLKLLEHSFPEVRSEATEIIGMKKGYMDADVELKNRIYKKIAELLVSKDYFIRETAVAVLGKIKDPDYAVFCMARQLRREDDISVIVKIIDVLGRYKNEYKEADNLLRSMLKSPKYETYREEIRKALRNESL